MVWSNESIIAFVTLFVTCVPLALLLWRYHKRRSHYSLNHDVESTIEFPHHRSNMHRTESFVLVQALVCIQ
ncbi:hypothetical protein B5807_00574 [Epicoccum nigrum]|uniref:Uncharacterized protein n=1 Tax=Epicoccum nigrum TaxID=105696 RepID=A0A1Y2MCC4_EPING|nr:hypothetical protein B5807_00574 [Epicoccum nigrum]